MKKIINIHWFQTNNIGDCVCGSTDYFSFPLPVEKVDIKELPSYPKAYFEKSFIILGGGGLIHLPAPEYNNGKFGYLEEIMGLSPWLVLWGIGHNVHGTFDVDSYPTCIKKAKLIGLRDDCPAAKDIGAWWTPSASCVLPFFQEIPSVVMESVGYYLHNSIPSGFYAPDAPIKYCEEVSFYEALNFIRSKTTIITNSYHGAYWAGLMGKKVIVPNRYSSKFTWLLHDMQNKKNFRDDCVTATNIFYQKVLRLINQYEEETDE